MIELRTLGTLALQLPGGEALQPVLAQPKRVALLVYLAIGRPRGFHRRDTLLALLWPEQDERHARWALNQALRHLRAALGKDVLPSRGDGEVGLDSSALWCDTVAFGEAIDAGEPARALELYRGDLLSGFHVSGCGDFERWLEEERGWLRRRACRAAADLASREEARGEAVAAGHWARHALALTHDDEGEARGLIELLGRVGDRAGALQVYDDLVRRLRADYEADPAPETQAAILAVRERALRTRAAPAPAPETVAGDDGMLGEPEAVAAQVAVKGRRRALLSTLGLLALVGAGAVISGPGPPPPTPHGSAGPTLPKTTIAVLPFLYRGTPELAYLSEGMVDLLSANLNGAGEIRAVTPHAILAVTRQAGGERFEPEQAQTMAGRLGAGSYVLGTVVETGGRLRISAQLYSGERSEDRNQAMVDGASTEIFKLVDGLTAQLIAQQAGGRATSLSRLAALTTDSLSALRAYLEGERYFRLGFLDSTVQAVDRAIRIDSSFALAYYRRATATLWLEREQESREAVARALKHADRLSVRDRQLIEAFAATVNGRIAEAEGLYRRIVTRRPDDVEASYQGGEVVFHRYGLTSSSWLDAREWFERVLAIEPNHQGAVYHLGNIAAREHKLQELDSLTVRALRLSPPPGWFFRGQRAVAFGDTAEIARFVAALRKASDDVAQPTAGFVVFTTGDLTVGRRLWGLLTEPSRARGLRVLAHLTLAKMELMGGRWRAGTKEFDAAAALDPATTLEHRAHYALWPLLGVPRSELVSLRDSLLRWRASPGSGNEGWITGGHALAHPYLRLFLLGLLSARLGEQDRVLDYAAELERRTAGSFAPVFVEDLARTLRAEYARHHGRLDLALATLDSVGFSMMDDLRRTGWSPFYDREYQQLARAEVLHALERYPESLEAYRVIADNLFHSGAQAHLRLAQIYERQGEPEKAAAHYGSFMELWKNCDSELQPLVEDARHRMSSKAGADQ